jgi:hypothetical protein
VTARRPLPLLALAAAVAAASGCAALRGAISPPPQGTPSDREGWLVYRVEAMRLEAPAAWAASGDGRHLRLEAPEGVARLEVTSPGEPLADEKACLAEAEKAMDRAASLERVRRHPTTFAGARGLAVEGDTGGWHVWAWAACDGGRQYQVFFTARTPASAAVLEVQRALATGARIGGVS